MLLYLWWVDLTVSFVIMLVYTTPLLIRVSMKHSNLFYVSLIYTALHP